METTKEIKEIRTIVAQWKKEGRTVGLVPTMGFLHQGHESLIRQSVKENDKTVVSVFVNPIQFGKNEDLETYPRDFNRDKDLCTTAGADLIFHPEPQEMYPDNFFTYVDMTTITDRLCGSNRPGHFQGVCTVVSKLFHIINPDKAYFGQKDAQQLSVIEKMVSDLNFDIEVVGCPTVREEDGLAKSSRNSYLSPQERKAALVIFKALTQCRHRIEAGERSANLLIKELKESLNREPLAHIDYVEIVDWEVLQPVDKIEKPVLVAVAVFIGSTRLIDNFIWR